MTDATIAITNKVRIGPAELVAAADLALIAVAATGTDCVDVAACAARSRSSFEGGATSYLRDEATVGESSAAGHFRNSAVSAANRRSARFSAPAMSSKPQIAS